ncbi:MAG: PDZ domain-containing protein, partial [Candidatus Sumerlaeia bacterium]|nr:PDZ domain-containing protein [Candidatus Sumerlaeia bacterium]
IPVAEFADSNKVEIGEWVLALGNPLDLNNSVSQGIISAKNRNISNGARIEELLQTTAVINPGNSGGPLVNLEGQIVGINNAIATSTGRWAGIGFAIPANQAERVSAMLIEKGRVTRGYLGIQMEDAPDEKGVEVMYVNADTPAMEVGLKEGDIVRRVNGERIYNRRDLLTAIGNRLAGEEVKLSIIRINGEQVEEKDLNVVLAERPSEETLSQLNIPSRRGGAQISPFFQDSPDLGITENFFEKFGFSIDTEAEVEEGIKVGTVTEGSEAEKAGLKAGDTLVQINGITITDEQTILDGFANVNPGDEHFVLFQRDGNNQFIRIPQ